MNDKELIQKIRLLKQVNPREDWVLLTKSRILSQEEFSPSTSLRVNWLDILMLRWKPVVVAPILTVLVVFGLTFTLAKSSLPGDFFYPVKRMSENTQVNLSSEKDKPKVHLELANKRLEELNVIAEGNRVGNLAPAIKEFQDSLAQAVKDINGIQANTSSDPVLFQQIVKETKKLSENKEKVELLGVVIGDTKDLDNALAKLVEREINDLEGRILNEDQWALFAKSREEFGKGNYSSALEKILLINNH
ncbi:MAG: hypothetical protein HYW70_02780 [Candidatus Nealsonbacteria bacterium]|nr:hypothetical protein [Candidatus Nealsonbacteria bacterium]